MGSRACLHWQCSCHAARNFPCTVPASPGGRVLYLLLPPSPTTPAPPLTEQKTDTQPSKNEPERDKNFRSVRLGMTRKQVGPLCVLPWELNSPGITRQFRNVCRSQKRVPRPGECSGSSQPTQTPGTAAQRFRGPAPSPPPSAPIRRLVVSNATVHLDNKDCGPTCLSGGLSVSERSPLRSWVLTELQAEAQEGQQRSEGQQQQEAIAEKHYYLFYLLFMISPQIGSMPCEQSRGNKHVFRGGKPGLPAENNPISPGLWQTNTNPRGRAIASAVTSLPPNEACQECIHQISERKAIREWFICVISA